MNYMEHLSIALFSAAATVGFALAAYRLFLKKKQADIMQHARVWTELQRVCIDLVQDSAVERAYILMLTNGGGVPMVGRQLYVTGLVAVTNELAHKKLTPVRGMEVDIPYLEMLIRARANGKCANYTDAMPGGLLKDIYNAEGVKYSEVFPVIQTQDAFFFASFSTYKADNLQSSQAEMSVAVNEMRKLMRSVFEEVK